MPNPGCPLNYNPEIIKVGCMITTITKIEGYLIKFEKFMILISSVTLLFSLSLQVIARYLLHFLSVPWTEELSIISFVLLTFYGAAYAYFMKKHLGVDNIVKKLSENNYIKFWYLKHVILIIFVLIVMIIYGIPVALSGLNNTYSIIQISRFYVFINIPIFGLFIIIHSLFAILRKDYLTE